MYTINVPEQNDSVSRITLAEKDYNIRFTYNPTGDYWMFSLYDLEMEPLICMIKIVPFHPLLYQYVDTALPDGIFGCWTDGLRVGKDDFKNKNAVFGFISNSELEDAGWKIGEDNTVS